MADVERVRASTAAAITGLSLRTVQSMAARREIPGSANRDRNRAILPKWPGNPQKTAIRSTRRPRFSREQMRFMSSRKSAQSRRG